MDTVIVNSGHYNKTVKTYEREYEGSPYHLTHVYVESAPNIKPVKTINKWWHAEGVIDIGGDIEGATYSRKIYNSGGKLESEDSGVIYDFDTEFVYKDSECYKTILEHGGSVVE